MTKRVLISGKVQGVYFRDSTRDQASKLGVKGWVRNLPDGRVEALFQGDGAAVEKMVQWCWQGSPRAKVDDVSVFDADADEEYSKFDITG